MGNLQDWPIYMSLANGKGLFLEMQGENYIRRFVVHGRFIVPLIIVDYDDGHEKASFMDYNQNIIANIAGFNANCAGVAGLWR